MTCRCLQASDRGHRVATCEQLVANLTEAKTLHGSYREQAATVFRELRDFDTEKAEFLSNRFVAEAERLESLLREQVTLVRDTIATSVGNLNAVQDNSYRLVTLIMLVAVVTAVVADEVRGLAKRTHEATQNIDGMIGRLQGDVAEVVNVIDRGKGEADQSVERTHRLTEELEAIFQQVKGTLTQIEQIAVANQEQTAIVRSVKSSTGRITELSNVVAESAQSCSGASAQLIDLSEGLEHNVANFKLVG